MFCFFYFLEREFVMKQQQTLKSELFFEGIGVHTGKKSSIRLVPACKNHGIEFINSNNHNEKILVGSVIPEVAMHATVIRSGKFILSTVEHLMAALMLMGVDNLIIFVEGTEVPILDGSSFSFVIGIMSVGLQVQDDIKKWITPCEQIIFSDEKGRFIQIDPSLNKEYLFIDYDADFIHPLNGKTKISGEVTEDFFVKEIAPARTFGMLHQLPFLRHHQLAQGTSLGNSVVIGDGELLNEMRIPDECVRHKFLDLIGDFSLLGKMLAGYVRAHKTSHNFNRLVIEHYIKFPEKWTTVCDF